MAGETYSRVERLFGQLQPLVANRGCNLIKQEWYHWQIKGRRGAVICDMWPTKYKYRTQFDVPKTYQSPSNYNDEVLTLIDEYNKQTRRPPPGVPVPPPVAGPPKPIPKPIPTLAEPMDDVVQRNRFADAELQLDNNELRLIINGCGYTQSMRLDRSSTLAYLAKASALLTVLANKLPEYPGIEGAIRQDRPRITHVALVEEGGLGWHLKT